MENITRTARRFVRKELKGVVSFETLSEYAGRFGYVIIFYNPDEPHELAIKYGYTESLSKKPALTIRKNNIKYIFINSTYSIENKTIFLAHELAHIILGHLDVDKNILDKEFQELQADTFAYTILNYKKPPHRLYALIGILSALLIMSVSYAVYLQSTGLNAPIII